MSSRVVDRNDFGALFAILRGSGYVVVGPTIRDGAIVYDRLSGVDDLPRGYTDRQEAGTYRLERRDDEALFGYTVGPHSWKKYLFPPRTTLLETVTDGDLLSFRTAEAPTERYAFMGVRACELAAMEIQDRVFLGQAFADRTYAQRRSAAFVVAVNCAVAGGTCFCSSMGTGPRCVDGFDLVVTEVIGDGRHEFVIESGSGAGADVLAELGGREATSDDAGRIDRIMAATEDGMGRSIDAGGLLELLRVIQQSPHWDDIAQRCLACGNCTLVCPTCFCTTMEDHGNPADGPATRTRRWDSCFSLDFTGLHGTPVRASTSSRYRQWMTHKLSTWHDQFGSSGCVGCGRCITWCPAGIDITKEAQEMAAAAP